MSNADVSCKPPRPREYLGDGLYAEFDGYQIWLIASNGDSDLSRVALDPSVYVSLREYAKGIGFE